MPGKKKLTYEEKKRKEAEIIARATKVARRYVKPVKKPKVKKESPLSRVMKRLGRLFPGSKYSSPRTRQIEEQLEAAKAPIKSDVKKRKRGGY